MIMLGSKENGYHFLSLIKTSLVINIHYNQSRIYRIAQHTLVLLQIKKMQRLNMELEVKVFFWLLCTAVLIGREPAIPPHPTHLGSYSRALLVSQDRRHLSGTR
jgi:hypothetical protein